MTQVDLPAAPADTALRSETWRLLIDPPLDGPANMAADEAILMAVGAGMAPPTLRLYRWEPACLSLGYAQPGTDVDRHRLAAQGWGLVRRMTGGRAILHIDELTYSVTLPVSHPLAAGGIVASCRTLSAALLMALERLGLVADARQKSAPSAHSGPICFEMPGSYEITAHGKKLLGSAQARRHGGVLQHGSLPLFGDIARICEALPFPGEAARDAARMRVRQRATTAADLGRAVTWEMAAEALAQGFRSAFGPALRPDTLSSAERTAAVDLRASRYANDAWTAKF